jgi:hypothetical protein
MAKTLVIAPLARIGVLLGIVGITGIVANNRFKHAGEWLPTNIPQEMGIWRPIDTPIPRGILLTLGDPQATARAYINDFGEAVQVSVIAAGAFENYHDPTVCVVSNGYFLTSKRNFKIDGPNSGEARAMIFKKTGSNGEVSRMLMYYWQQNRDATTATEPVMGNYRDLSARFRTGYGAVVQGRQTCLVRVYTTIPPLDKDGVQSQRNVHEISQALYRALKESGKAQD